MYPPNSCRVGPLVHEDTMEAACLDSAVTGRKVRSCFTQSSTHIWQSALRLCNTSRLTSIFLSKSYTTACGHNLLRDARDASPFPGDGRSDIRTDCLFGG